MKLIQAASYILTRALALNKLMDLEIYQLVDFLKLKYCVFRRLVSFQRGWLDLVYCFSYKENAKLWSNNPDTIPSNNYRSKESHSIH